MSWDLDPHSSTQALEVARHAEADPSGGGTDAAAADMAAAAAADAHARASAFRAQHDMAVEDDESGPIPHPLETFESAGFPEPLLNAVGAAVYPHHTYKLPSKCGRPCGTPSKNPWPNGCDGAQRGPFAGGFQGLCWALGVRLSQSQNKSMKHQPQVC